MLAAWLSLPNLCPGNSIRSVRGQLDNQIPSPFRDGFPDSPDTDTTTTPLLRTQSHDHPNYGTTPRIRKTNTSVAHRRGFNPLSLRLPRRSGILTSPSSPVFTPSNLRDMAYSRLTAQRPISAYDGPYMNKDTLESDDALAARINGVRVWYSSFQSIDWLHDAIKVAMRTHVWVEGLLIVLQDSLRFSRLRRRKSWRAKIHLVWDKSTGWIIVTIVGFLTAIVAYLVVRAEKLLFDFKEGYCEPHWWKPKSFCCNANLNDNLDWFNANMVESCDAWRSWSDVFSAGEGKLGNLVEYISYTFVAVCCPTGLLGCLSDPMCSFSSRSFRHGSQFTSPTQILS